MSDKDIEQIVELYCPSCLDYTEHQFHKEWEIGHEYERLYLYNCKGCNDTRAVPLLRLQYIKKFGNLK